MRLCRVTLVPIEFFDRSCRSAIEEDLISRDILTVGYDDPLKLAFTELTDDVPNLYPVKQDARIKVAFHGSSACFCRFDTDEGWSFTEENVKSELMARRNNHMDCISYVGRKIFGIQLMDIGTLYPVKPNYAFSMYFLQSDADLNQDERQLLRIFSEPSTIDIDDMIYSSKISRATQRYISSHKEDYIGKIMDVDISTNSVVHVTWASVTAHNCGDDVSFKRLLDIVISLEIRLQIIWNKCHGFGNYADDVLTRKKRDRHFEDLYWNISQAVDDAQGVLASTVSSRASIIFDAMVKTSRLESVLKRLEGKVTLCEKFLTSERTKHDRKYRIAIETLLLITAISQLFPIMFILPIDYVKERPIIGAATILTLLIAGMLSIGLRG